MTGNPFLGAMTAIAAAGIGLGVRLLAAPWMPPGYPFLTFFPVIVIVTLLLGWKQGSLCAVLCGLLAWYFFIIPLNSLAFDPGVAMALTFFIFVVATQIVLIHWLQRFVASAAREREANRKLAENRELLFSELQHRVSNNLQVVAALLSLQKRDVTDERARAALDEAANRLALIGKIGRQLHDPNGTQLGVKPFLESLCGDLLEASGRTDITCRCDVADDMILAPDSAIPIALIIAESIANALEHGFTSDRGGEIDISYGRSTRGKVMLEIRDNGRGLPQGFSLEKSQSLGLRIAQTLSRQLGGEFMLVQEDRTTARLMLPA
ncbi:two-component sensor histidine kinase [Sphingobium boeckii]|uniref:histidine kinase n=2 Tax=Sphingobium boeckii TaxID=1082345 RepID=A0A7W9AF14_9SPHN|nr:two-component sensor histidine kinase [Sphingobium boeckii]